MESKSDRGTTGGPFTVVKRQNDGVHYYLPQTKRRLRSGFAWATHTTYRPRMKHGLNTDKNIVLQIRVWSVFHPWQKIFACCEDLNVSNTKRVFFCF
jgi:hypothetical protein